MKDDSKNPVLSTKIFDVIEKDMGGEDSANTVYLVEAPDWVHVIPLLKNEKNEECFIMVEQYRYGGGIKTLEFPGGMVDSGEKPEEAAEREFLEETGCRAGSLKLIGKVNPNPAFMTNSSCTFLAEEIECSGEQNLDENEDVNFRKVPVKDILSGKEEGFFHHAVMINALYWFIRERSLIRF
ncbi:MAG: NUDIX hydrolase [Spirochaetia bacterium]